ncbi:MAG: hypothetical protein GY928_33830 [Colwellia sp.]|nr:hypothetical protein [Colwellia sp.]
MAKEVQFLEIDRNGGIFTAHDGELQYDVWHNAASDRLFIGNPTNISPCLKWFSNLWWAVDSVHPDTVKGDSAAPAPIENRITIMSLDDNVGWKVTTPGNISPLKIMEVAIKSNCVYCHTCGDWIPVDVEQEQCTHLVLKDGQCTAPQKPKMVFVYDEQAEKKKNRKLAYELGLQAIKQAYLFTMWLKKNNATMSQTRFTSEDGFGYKAEIKDESAAATYKKVERIIKIAGDSAYNE